MNSTSMNDTNKQQPTLLVMAGGTGGHIFPGIAVANKLENQGWKIHWLGTEDRMEAHVIPEYGYDISFINISGIRNKNLMSWLVLPFKLVKSLFQAKQVLDKIKPNVVLGMGGYASAPGGLVSWLMNTPLVIHEQNAVAGLSNRLLARIATKVCCAFPNAFNNMNTIEVVGNPIRKEFSDSKNTNIEKSKDTKSNTGKESKNILVVGGSLGAQVLNEVVPKSFIELIQTQPDFNIWHQTGVGKQKEVLAAYSSQGADKNNVKVSEFIKDIASAYHWADIVICRAGALTVSELAMSAKPAIFIPLPHAVDDHQTKNAQYLVSRKAAKLISQKNFTSNTLTSLLNELFDEKSTLIEMSKAAYLAADVDATKKVAEICQKLLRHEK